MMQKRLLILQKWRMVLSVEAGKCKIMSKFIREEITMKLTKWKKILGKCGNVLALAAVFMTANSACCWYYHQPKFPQEADQLRKCKND